MIPEDVRATVCRHVRPLSWQLLMGDHEQATVWRVDSTSGRVIVKSHHARASADREITAYRRWAPALGGCAPPLLAAEGRTLLLGFVDGERGDRADVDRLELFRELGRLAALFHGGEVSADPVPLDEAWGRRVRSWARRARPWVAGSELEALIAAVDATALACPRVPCHRDLTLRNCLVQGRGAGMRVTWLDFGQARADDPLSDVVKLAGAPWDARQRRAFFDGYGRVLSAGEDAWLETLIRVERLAGLAWARGRASR